MSFPWLSPSVEASFQSRVPSFRHAMHKADLHTRASLLLRLGHSRDVVVARCREYLRWEFETLPSPTIQAEIEAIVDAIVARSKGGKATG